MSGNDPWGDLEYLLMLRQRSPAYAELIEPFRPAELLAPIRAYEQSWPQNDEMKKAADDADLLWADIHQTFVDIVGYAFEPAELDPSQREEYWQRFGRKDDHIKRLRSISIHASALAKLLTAEPSAVELHTSAGGRDRCLGLTPTIEYIQRIADQAAAYGTPEKVGEVRDDDYYRVSAVRRLIWEPVFSLYHRRFGRLPNHRSSKPIQAIMLLSDIIGLPEPKVESLLDAQASFTRGASASF